MSEKIKGKLIVHACGGGGSNMATDVFAKINALPDSFAKASVNYVDTSRANIDNILPGCEFFQLQSKQYGASVLDGSGGERRKNAEDIISGVKDYLDKKKLATKVTGEYHIVVFSASGGSGSVLGTMLVKNLLDRNIPTIAIVIGDSSTALTSINTVNTLASLSTIAVNSKKALTAMYVNNKNYGDSVNSALRSANEAVFKSVAVLSAFLSGLNESIDHQDMLALLDQTSYSTITVKPGLYALTTFGRDIKIPEGSIPTVARSLSSKNESPDIGIPLLGHKYGRVIDEDMLSVYNGQFPLHVVALLNFFTHEEQHLKSLNASYRQVMDNIIAKEVSGEVGSQTDESGLVL